MATVSRVLANKGKVRPETREQVLEAVEALGYRPNRVASSLRKQKSNVIGLLVSDIRNPFFTAIARAIEDMAHQHEMSVFFCNTDEDPEKEERYLRTLLDEKVAGIILSPTTSEYDHFRSVLEMGTPIVVIDRRIEGAEADCVVCDNAVSAETLTNHLIEQGYQRIGAVIGLKVSTTGRERMAGYKASMRRHGLESLESFVEPNESASEAVVKQWLNAPHPPDAILAGNSRMVIGALNAIKNAGLSIPDDIALAAFDETIWTPHVASGITVISQPTYDIGRTAAELLMQRIADSQRPPRDVILKGKLIERSSTQRRGG